MRAGVHDLLLDHAGDFPLNSQGEGNVVVLPPDFFQGDNLFAVGTFGHDEIVSHHRLTPS